MPLEDDVKKIVKGEVKSDKGTLATFSKDASLLIVRPKLVVAPKDVEDISALVRYVISNKNNRNNLSITARSAGTDMSGGPLNESIILDMLPNFAGTLNVNKERLEATVLPGTYYRDFEKMTLAKGLLMPSYTASRELCTVGGMVSNNAGGEKTLRYGKVEDFLLHLKIVLSDGHEYEIKPLSKQELEQKILETTFEGQLYSKLYKLIVANQELLNSAKPKVSKNSAGYYLWNVWDGQTFDLTKLIVGSQGTLGIVTEITFRLVPVKKVSRLLIIFLRDLTPLADITNTILRFKPESLEVYDDNTLKLAFRFFPDLLRILKPKHLFKMMLGMWPEVLMVLRGGMPKLVLMVEAAGDTEEEVMAALENMHNAVTTFHRPMRITRSTEETNEFWVIRRESFNLLRKHVHGRRTAPFIDDIIVKPEVLPEFLPKLRAILDEYKLVYTIAGHDGNGNLHIIPLMDMHDKKNIGVIMEVSERVYDLVLSYKGSITAEHNDGIIRTPYLQKMYGAEIIKLFQETKHVFDPLNIFNPGKKVPDVASGIGAISYIEKHISVEA